MSFLQNAHSKSETPFVVEHRALRDFARSKGVAITALSDEEKKQFLRPNPEYKKPLFPIAAAFYKPR